MKKRYIYSCLIAGATFIVSCTKNFEQINTDPTKVSLASFDPNSLMAQAQITFANSGYDQLLFQSMWSQSLASTYDYYSNGDKYVPSNSFQDYKGRTWNTSFNAATLVFEMQNLFKDKPELSNTVNCGTILNMMILQRITDAYGDMPFSQALKAKTDGIFLPVFDSQQSIYVSMLDQLDKATAALNASQAGPKNDLFYAGNVAQWKKLGYSLMLRAAMRLTKVDPATAQKYAEKAYAGGTLGSIADNTKVKTDFANGNQNNTVSALLTVDDFREVRWSKPLIDYLKTTTDPRISAIAEIAVGNGRAANEDETTAGDNTAALQNGLPNGYDLKGGANDVSKAPGYPGATPAANDKDSPAPLGKYSRPRLKVYYDRNNVNMLLTYGETELLLAEASSRGWNTGVAATHFANALAADMRTLTQFNALATIDDATIAAYIAAHPLVPATALQQINYEYWIEASTTFNFNESWANWRRSGFPVLTSVVYPGQFATSIPRRIVYPVSLQQTNAQNYAAAVSKLKGGDSFTERVWWDK